MMKLFTDDIADNDIIMRDTRLEYWLSMFNKELLRVKENIISRHKIVRNNHILCRLLKQGYVPTSYNRQIYDSVVSDRMLDITRTIGFTNNIHYGKLFNNIFSNGINIIMAYEDDFYVNRNNWKECCPVKYMYHDSTSLNYNIGNNLLQSNLAIISVNITMLFAMYRYYILEKEKMDLMNSPNDFVMNHVLVNMLNNSLSMSLWNRSMNIITGKPINVFMNYYPIALTDYSDKYDKTFDDVYKNKFNKRLHYNQLLKAINLLNVDALNFFKLPDMLFTRQVYWAILLARLPIIRDIIILGGLINFKFNLNYINALILLIRKINNMGLFTRIDNENIQLYANNLINEIKTYIDHK
jgi:hypothetical protein